MMYEIRQLTRYSYATFVPVSRHLVRLTPRAGPQLDVESCTISIDPRPSERSEDVDFFGNGVTHIALDTPHNALVVESRAVVRLKLAPPIDPAATPPWEEVARAAHAAASLDARSPAHQLFASRHVPMDEEIGAYAAESFTPGRPVLAAAFDLACRIEADFTYDPVATDVMTPVRRAFEQRRGVCQDFAHIMISGLRTIGLAAAYVSGYLRTVELPGRPRLEGADGMHAWVSVWCGEVAGWQGLDPTNAVMVGADHVPLAFGRDYADVSPIDGVIVGGGSHTLHTGVDVARR